MYSDGSKNNPDPKVPLIAELSAVEGVPRPFLYIILLVIVLKSESSKKTPCSALLKIKFPSIELWLLGSKKRPLPSVPFKLSAPAVPRFEVPNPLSKR